ncbi:peptidase [Cellvibrio sp. KY-GH-1]|uniref:PepSY domain-containing protein n=1 Tax=Cellvibrio sp. KY-GH-1 TaxID=2303332 RepID=UPI001246C44A|nr:PepSY domain-containing protein [Cellvibrio sp. KY-GH-1]QEY17682.1 peptidase [Cellvibrio sp. KY-GH-1]
MNSVARVVLLLLLLTSSVSARDLSQDEALRLREQGRIIPLEQVLSLIAQRHPQASLLEVELEEDDDIYIYEVELATGEGLVRELEIDASTGKILKDEEDD